LEINFELFLEHVRKSLKDRLPFVVYSIPGSAKVKSMFFKDRKIYSTLNYLKSGFVFAPFNSDQPSILFPVVKASLYEAKTPQYNNFHSLEGLEIKHELNSDKNKYIALVEKGIDFIKAEKIQKIVLSRKIVVERPILDIPNLFLKLLELYKNAFVYIWFHPDIGLWIGATPETLLSVYEQKFKTMALAGTQPYNGDLMVKWEEKEKIEQQFVTDFILRKLTDLSAEIKVSQPYTVKYGNILHLCTDISGLLSSKLSIKELINQLHPTPAVCGLPRNKAKNFIFDNEAYEREYYTGFLGELNLKGESNFYVNLRCQQIFDKHISVYVGGGITKDSVAEKEWFETVAKSKAMLRIINY
jgi:isochorismate synthase